MMRRTSLGSAYRERIISGAGCWTMAGAILLSGCSPRPGGTAIRVWPGRVTADGESEVAVRYTPPGARVEIVGRKGRARLEMDGSGRARVVVGVLPGVVRLRATFAGRDAEAYFVSAPDAADSVRDGTPDFLRLLADDRQAFRRWFTFLAEAQYYREPTRLPAEIGDCAALIRYAFREALSEHDSAWANRMALPLTPAIPSPRKYVYPYTPLGAALFRVRPGPFSMADARDGAFSQFADANTIERWNCHRVSREIDEALPGDLLFYKQLSGDARHPFHGMIFLGPSQFESGAGRSGERLRYVIYHTGPSDAGRGEIRRLTVGELVGYPSPQWRPLAGNPNFLGVYRWNIL